MLHSPYYAKSSEMIKLPLTVTLVHGPHFVIKHFLVKVWLYEKIRKSIWLGGFLLMAEWGLNHSPFCQSPSWPAPHIHLCPSPIDHTHSRHYVKLCALPASGISFPSSLPIKSYSRSPCKDTIPLSWPTQSCEGSLGRPPLVCLQSRVYTTIRTAIFLLRVVDFYVCLGLPAKNTWHLVKLYHPDKQNNF